MRNDTEIWQHLCIILNLPHPGSSAFEIISAAQALKERAEGFVDDEDESLGGRVSQLESEVHYGGKRLHVLEQADANTLSRAVLRDRLDDTIERVKALEERGE